MAIQLNIKNFKSLINCDITLKPITLLFGPNNNGKSSLINSLFFLSENMTQIHTTNFKLGKQNLSSYKEVVSFNDEEKDIIFELKTTVEVEKFNSTRKKGIAELGKISVFKFNDLENLYSFEESILKRLERKEIKANIFFSNNVDAKMPFRKLKKIEIFIEDKSVISVNFEKVYFLEDEEGNICDNSGLAGAMKGCVELFFSEKKEIVDILKEKFENYLEFIVNPNIASTSRDHSLRNPKIIEFEDLEALEELKNLLYNKELSKEEQSRLIEKRSRRILVYNKEFTHLYQYNNFTEYFKREEKYELITDFTEEIFNQFTQVVYLFSHLMTSQWGVDLPTFNKHLGPIRERPKHKYLINGDVDYSNDFYFDQILSLEFVDEITDAIENAEEVLPYFFEETSILIKKNEDVGRLFIKQGDAVFNLAEASSGLLQLLPILIKKPKVIEQPELHLHPKLQAKFADLFVYWFIEKKKEVIVETHSEHILRKLQVLVAEGQVSSNDVAVYYFDKKDGETKIIHMEMEENGLFKNNWPEGFFDDKANLTFALMDAIKNRN